MLLDERCELPLPYDVREVEPAERVPVFAVRVVLVLVLAVRVVAVLAERVLVLAELAVLAALAERFAPELRDDVAERVSVAVRGVAEERVAAVF